MERRHFIGAAGLGLLFPALPGWLRAGFQEAERQDTGTGDDQGEGEGHGHCPNPYVRSTLERARGLGKPTLVFVVPAEARDRPERRQLFGQYLNLCDDDALLDLALCEVLCAAQADLAVHVPEAAKAEDPLMVLVGRRGKVEFVKDDLPDLLPLPFGRDEAEFTKSIEARVATLAGRVHALVAPDRQAIALHAVDAETSLGEERVERVRRALESSDELEPALADAAAALLLEVPATDLRAPALRSAVLEGVRARLREGPPFGANWASSSGCGSTIEEVPEGHPAYRADAPPPQSFLMACGMAHVPAVSERFLSFWGDQGVD